MPKIKVVCRYGVEYSLLARGTKGEVHRLKEILSNCCCYVCHNRGCETPIEGKQECRNEMQKHQPFGWLKVGDLYFHIICVGETSCRYDDGAFYKYEEAAKYFTFVDGTPFGVLEDE